MPGQMGSPLPSQGQRGADGDALGFRQELPMRTVFIARDAPDQIRRLPMLFKVWAGG